MIDLTSLMVESKTEWLGGFPRNRNGGKEAAEPQRKISVMAMTMFRVDGAVGAQAIFSSFIVWATLCISNCSGVWGIGHISYCYTGW